MLGYDGSFATMAPLQLAIPRCCARAPFAAYLSRQRWCLSAHPCQFAKRWCSYLLSWKPVESKGSGEDASFLKTAPKSSINLLKIRRPGSACTVFFFLCRIQNLSQNPKSKIPKLQNPKSKIPKIQNPKSKIPKIQNPKSPKSPKSKIFRQNPKFGALGASHKDLLHNDPKSKIQNPQNPKSKIPKIQNPKSKIPKIQNPKSPRSKIQNPKSPHPESKIPEIHNPKSPKSKIQNPRNLGPHKDVLHNGPKSKIQNPQNRPKKFGFWILGWGILDFGFRPQNPKSPRSKIQNPQNPKSKIPKIQNPKSEIPKIQNPKSPKSPKSKIFRQNPKFGALGASHKDLLHNDPKSKIQNPQNPKFGDFGFWIRGILDFGFWGFWILDLGDFGFWIWGILDFGSWGFWILGILDFGFCWFWCFWGGPGDVPLGNLVTVLGGQRLESPLARLSGTVQNQLYLI